MIGVALLSRSAQHHIQVLPIPSVDAHLEQDCMHVQSSLVDLELNLMTTVLLPYESHFRIRPFAQDGRQYRDRTGLDQAADTILVCGDTGERLVV